VRVVELEYKKTLNWSWGLKETYPVMCAKNVTSKQNKTSEQFPWKYTWGHRNGDYPRTVNT
jgi:hypothetical protein